MATINILINDFASICVNYIFFLWKEMINEHRGSYPMHFNLSNSIKLALITLNSHYSSKHDSVGDFQLILVHALNVRI